MKTLFIDLETSGLDEKECGIVQISGLIDIDGEIIEQFDFNVNIFPDQIIWDSALEVIGKTREEISSYLNPNEVYSELIKIFDRYINRYNREDKFYFVGQNPDFDKNFLREFFIRNGNKYLFSYIRTPVIDLISVTAFLSYHQKIKIKDMRLETVANYLNIPLKAHDALEDIKATRNIFNKYKNYLK